MAEWAYPTAEEWAALTTGPLKALCSEFGITTSSRHHNLEDRKELLGAQLPRDSAGNIRVNRVVWETALQHRALDSLDTFRERLSQARG